jgi:hypothetical protein
MGEKVPASEQFHVECGARSASLMNRSPRVAEGLASVPGTAGGMDGAHPCTLAAEAGRLVTLKTEKITHITARNLT